MFTIGLTGGIGTGKSEVALLLQRLGAAVVDADKLGHEVYRPGTEGWQAVVDAFGREVLQPSGEVDRKKLGALVFGNPPALAKLNALMHPRIAAIVKQRFKELEARGTKVAVLEAAVLIEAQWMSLVDEVWVTTADEAVSIQRIQARNGLPEEAVRARIRSQLPAAERNRYATVVIENNGSLQQLRERVQGLWNTRILTRIGEHVHNKAAGR